jgi:calcineurin-like phosphoesterase family protein
MLKSLKISASPDSIWLWSDTHWQHDKFFILEPRHFATVEEHDTVLIERWNKTVSLDGTFIHLGDFCMRCDEPKFWSIVRRLNFKRLFMLAGNHNSGFRQAYETALKVQFPNAFAPTDGTVPAGVYGHYEVYPLHVNVDGNPEKVVTFLPEYVEFTVGKIHFVASHYPLSSWHHMSHGSLMLAGHTHGNLKEKLSRRLDLGVEVFDHPVSLAEILRLTASQEIAKVDHH